MKRREYIKNFVDSGASRSHARRLYRAYRRAGAEPVEETAEPVVPRDVETLVSPRSLLEGTAVTMAPSNGLVIRPAASRPNYDNMSFNKAFATAKRFGARVFTWRGQQYTTEESPYWQARWGLNDRVLEEPAPEEATVVIPGDEAFLSPLADYTPENTIGMFSIDKELAQNAIDNDIAAMEEIREIPESARVEDSVIEVPPRIYRVPVGYYDMPDGPGVAYTTDPESVSVTYPYEYSRRQLNQPAGHYARQRYAKGGVIPNWAKYVLGK